MSDAPSLPERSIAPGRGRDRYRAHVTPSLRRRIARQLKHRAFLRVRWAHRRGEDAYWRFLTAVAPVLVRHREYRFDPARYRRSFLTRSAPPSSDGGPLAHRVFVIWEGPMSTTRQRNAQNLERYLGVPLVWITPETVGNWVVEDHPLHPAVEHLSLVHRSDYLRAYLLHHHGGGYVDLKRPEGSWVAAFDRASAAEDAWVTAYRERDGRGPAKLPGRLGRDLRWNFPRLVGGGALIARPRTPFTAEWLREVERRLDYLAPQAAEFPGGDRGEVVGYPASWNDLLGKIYYPLQLKHLDHVRGDDDLRLDFADYR